MKPYRLVFTTLFVLIVLAGCVSLPIPVTAPVAPTASFDDPFAYCAAVGAIDAPDSRYTGEQPPPAVIQGIRAAMGAPADAPDEWYRAGAEQSSTNHSRWHRAEPLPRSCWTRFTLDGSYVQSKPRICGTGEVRSRAGKPTELVIDVMELVWRPVAE